MQDTAGLITVANPRAREILGLTRDEITGRTSFDPRWEAITEDGEPFPGDRHPAMVTLTTGASCRDVVMGLAHPDGRRIWISINSEVLRHEDGAVTGVVASFTDVTSRRELELRLRAAERQEAVGQLAGGIAHEFNNILAAITGYGEMARDALPADSVPRADVEAILYSSGRAARLVQQLLAFGGRPALQRVVVDPGEVAGMLAPMLEGTLGETIRLQLTRDDSHGRVRMDLGQLEQVFVNLALSARDAMPGGGTLAINIRSVQIPAADSRTDGPVGDCVRFTVADTGMGMDEAARARVFQPFFTPKDGGGLRGLGLASVYGIVTSSGGWIQVASTPGRGTTFTIHLPRIVVG